MSEASLEELLIQLQTEWQEAVFNLFYTRTHGLVFAYLKKRLFSVEAAEEVLQIVYMQLYRKIDQYDAKFKALQWLYVIAQSESRDYWLKEKRHILNRKDEINFDQVSQSEVPSPILSRVELDSLSPDQRAVIEGRYIDDLEFDEIAKKLGKSTVNVRKILSRAIDLLRVKAQPKSKGG